MTQMRSRIAIAKLRALCLSVAILLVGPVLATAEQTPGEIVREGISAEDYLAGQQRLHAWLIDEVSPKALASSAVRVQLSPDERRDLERSVPSGPGPLKIGLVKPVSPAVVVSGFNRKRVSKLGSPLAGGIVQATEDGGFVWAASVASEGAGAVRVRLTGVQLPPSADLYFFGPGGEAYGPYQGKGPDGDGDFWTDSVFDSNAVIVLRHFGPATREELRRISFTISAVGHIGPRFPAAIEQAGNSFCGNPTCVVDASCVTDQTALNAVAKASDAVGQMEWISGAFIYTCTGGLLADTDAGTQIPYFLTANHCLSRGKDAKNLEAFFFYRTQSCGDSCPSNTSFPKTRGATIKATDRAGDFTLLELGQTPPAGTQMLGWNNDPVAFGTANLYRISHPNFGAQVFSQHQVDANAPTCSSWPRGERIYSRDVVGATDGGSSGSPVVNAAGEVVGQLSGACGFNVNDSCDSASNRTVDGALAFYWDKVAPFLAPGGGGGCTPAPEVCTDGDDNDCDGAVDCSDSDCSADPACAGGGCVLGQPGTDCTADSQCCSNKCTGPPGRKTCR